MAGFAAALKGLMGLSDSSYKAQQEFLQTDWFNRNNLQREQIGNVGMEATRANMAAQAANLELDRRRTALAEAEAERIRSSQNLAASIAERNRRLNLISQGIITPEGTPGAASVFPPISNIPPSGDTTVPPASTVTGAPVVSAPSSPAVVAPPTSSVVSVGRSSTGAGFPSVQQTPAPVQTQVPPPPTAVPPAQQAQVQHPMETATGRVIPPIPPSAVTELPVVPRYAVPQGVTNVDAWREEIGARQAYVMRGWQQAAEEAAKSSPAAISALIGRINSEATGWARNFGGLNQEFSDYTANMIRTLRAAHGDAVLRVQREDEDRSRQIRRDDATIANLERGYRDRPLTVEEKRAYGDPNATMLSDVINLTPGPRSGSNAELPPITPDIIPRPNGQTIPHDPELMTTFTSIWNSPSFTVTQKIDNISDAMVRYMLSGQNPAGNESMAQFLAKMSPEFRSAVVVATDDKLKREQGEGRGNGSTTTPQAPVDVNSAMRNMGVTNNDIILNQNPGVNRNEWARLRNAWLQTFRRSRAGAASVPRGWVMSGGRPASGNSRSGTGADEAAILEAAGAVE